MILCSQISFLLLLYERFNNRFYDRVYVITF